MHFIGFIVPEETNHSSVFKNLVPEETPLIQEETISRKSH